jgi:CheY-like chemotaxis protein
METILLVEDDPSNRRVLALVLRIDGYDVIEAATAEEAEEAGANNTPIHLLVIDLGLAGCSGTEVALTLVKSHLEVPVLFVSGTPKAGWSDRDLCNFERLQPAVAFLEKPFLPADLRAEIRKLMAQRFEFSL